jgi:hypothetical protein
MKHIFVIKLIILKRSRLLISDPHTEWRHCHVTTPDSSGWMRQLCYMGAFPLVIATLLENFEEFWFLMWNAKPDIVRASSNPQRLSPLPHTFPWSHYRQQRSPLRSMLASPTELRLIPWPWHVLIWLNASRSLLLIGRYSVRILSETLMILWCFCVFFSTYGHVLE